MTFRIAIIGTGNVAWHLARVLENAGHVIVHIYSRDVSKAKKFGLDFFNASFGHSTDMSAVEADLFIMAVSDDAIENLAQELSLPLGATLVHTSGSVTLQTLGYAQTNRIGVFYPIQTFTKGNATDFSSIPICIEGESEETLAYLQALASSISSSVHQLTSSQRKIIHLSAVFACNFSNHMFTLAKQILEESKMEFDLLKPLVVETLNKSFEVGPEKAQTGPAIRKDMETLDRQFNSLQNDPELAEMYKVISQHIIDFYSD